MIDFIQWLGHGSFRLQGPPLIYVNPWRIARNAFLADLILISSERYACCSPADVRKLLGPETVVVANTAAAVTCEEADVQVLRPWQSLNVGRARVTALPAYTARWDGQTVENGGLGFLISLDYYDIYYAGDTIFVPEMARIHPDIAILPIGANGTMGIDEAVEAVRALRPRWVLPSHWGGVEGGTYFDVRAFQAAVGDLGQVLIPDRVR